MSTGSSAHFDQQYHLHLKHLKLKGLQPKTIDVYARAIRRLGGYFSSQIDALSEAQLTEYFSEPIGTHFWSAVKRKRPTGPPESPRVSRRPFGFSQANTA